MTDAFFFFGSAHTGPEVHPAPCSVYIGDIVRSVKRPERGADTDLDSVVNTFAPVCAFHYCRQFTGFALHELNGSELPYTLFQQPVIQKPVPVIADCVGAVFYLTECI